MRSGAAEIRRKAKRQAGFTLTEMLVGLAVGAGLVLAIAEFTGMTARVWVGFVQNLEALRAARQIDFWLEEATAADLRGRVLEATRIELARSDELRLAADWSDSAPTDLTASLVWRRASDDVGIQGVLRFREGVERLELGDGLAVILTDEAGRSLATTPLRRTVPPDCVYDPASKSCVQ